MINALTIARYLSEKHKTPIPFITGREFAPLLDGCSYVDPVQEDARPEELARVIAARRARYPDLRVAQVFANPDKNRMTRSFGIESWRLAGELPQYGTVLPLFDRRDSKREAKLLHGIDADKPLVLFAGAGVSSPFPHSDALLQLLVQRLAGYCVIDLSRIKAERLYDLGALFERARLLVSIDTAHLWLARAFPVPTVAILNNGWLGSPPPPCSVAAFRYGQIRSLEAIVAACKYALRPAGLTLLVVDAFGDSARHKAAAKTWAQADVVIKNRSPKGVLPDLKDLLSRALHIASGKDVVIWTNDDVQLLPGACARLAEQCSRYGAVTVRRHSGHIGRELFAATTDWLRDHMADMPSMTLSMPWFDLALAAYVRATKGIRSAMQNLMDDMEPCEINGAEILHHPEHESAWIGKENSPLAEKNRAEFERILNRPVYSNNEH